MSESDTPRTDAVQIDMEQSTNTIEYQAHQYRDLARQLERELAQAQARRTELEKFRKFVGLLLFDYCENWGTDIGGDMIEEYLLKSGLAAREMVTEPCGEYCQCADINDFPLECNRLSKEAMLAKHDLPATLSEPDQEPDDSSSKG